jgi:hypothetical protein
MTGYREKLSPAVWLIVAIGLFLPASMLIFLPLSIPLGVAVGLVLWWGSVAILWAFAPSISVDERGVQAGRARIDHSLLGTLEVFRKEDARAQRGVSLDARAWLVITPWIDPVLKITVIDDQDPTPYWLVSCKNPEKFQAAFEQARSAT